MIVIVSCLIGIALGVRGARRRQGTRGDLVQWGAASGIAGALLGLILTILLANLI